MSGVPSLELSEANWPREAPTLPELLEAVSALQPEQAAAILAPASPHRCRRHPIRRVTDTAVRFVGGFHRADHASGTAALVHAQGQESERAAADVRQPKR